MITPASVPVPLLRCDARGRVAEVNDRCEALFGRRLAGRHLDDVLGPRGHARLSAAPSRARLAGRRADGTPFTVDAEAAPDDEGGLVVVLEPLSGGRLLDETQRFMDVAFESLPAGMALFDTDGRYIRVNAALTTFLGRPAQELLGRRDQELTHPDDRAADLAAAERILGGEIDTWTCEKRFLRPDGTVVWALASLFFLRDRAGLPLCWFGQFQDVTSHHRSAYELRHVAEHDELTGLANRRRLLADLEQHLQHAARQDDHGAVLLLDLDGFKRVNDTLGHEAGDAVLVTVARALHARLRETDTLGRMGGDEFAALLPGSCAATAGTVADDLLDAVREAAPDGVTASCGIALYGPAVARDASAVLAAADRAMYAAKQGGRDGTSVAA